MRRKFTNKYEDILKNNGPLAVLESMQQNIVNQNKIRVYGWENNGASSYDFNLINSVSLFLFEELKITEAFIPEDFENRPKIIKESTKYITVHDTASAREGGGATAHMKYVTNGGGGTSWHYSLGNDGTYLHLPHNEVAYHAGDGRLEYRLEDTKVKATNTKPNISISYDGFYTFNNEKSPILAPTKDGHILTEQYINDLGLEVQIKNGKYHLGSTWYSKTYDYIGNGGGNRNSIGIESCIDKGSDIYLTWQLLAKLVAYLLDVEKLDLDAVVQHHFFSGKDCPKTMRRALMWDHFLDLVEAEYFIRTALKDYTIKIDPLSSNLQTNGRIKLTNPQDRLITYKLIITKDEEKYEKEFKTIIN